MTVTEAGQQHLEIPLMLDVFLARPYVLSHREDEPGEKLVFSRHFQPGVPEYNLRGQLTTDDDGAFEFETVVPSPYEIPKDGATGRLLAALGRHFFRPGHIHFKLSHRDAPRPYATGSFDFVLPASRPAR